MGLKRPETCPQPALASLDSRHHPVVATFGALADPTRRAILARVASGEAAFDDYPGDSLATVVLVEQHGKTEMTNTLQYDSQAARDAVIKSGMEHSAAESFDKLAELLPSIE